MSLYAIGDLHLSFTANKPMDVFGREWKDHVRKIEKNWRGRIGAEDTVVITGDHSWGRNLEEALADLDFIQSLLDCCTVCLCYDALLCQHGSVRL